MHTIDTPKIEIRGSGFAISLFIFPLDSFNRSAHCSIMHADIFCYIFYCVRGWFFVALQKYKTRGRFVCHILRIYIYLIKSPPAVKRISLFQFFYILILIRQRFQKTLLFYENRDFNFNLKKVIRLF